MIVDATITIGNIVEISVITVGMLGAFFTVRNKVTGLTERVTEMKTEISGLTEKVNTVSTVLTAMEFTNRRITNVEQDIRELRHGRGFVQIDGEYPRRGE